jgi:hypothetical protein
MLEKVGLAALVALFAACGMLYVGETVKSRGLAEEVSDLRARLTECRRQQDAIAAAIKKQNAAIEAVRVDTVFVVREIEKVITKYGAVRKEILQTAERDTGCENKVVSITNLLRDFGGVHGKDGDKD